MKTEKVIGISILATMFATLWILGLINWEYGGMFLFIAVSISAIVLFLTGLYLATENFKRK